MNTVIAVENVSMKYHVNASKTTSLKEWVVSGLRGKLKYKDFYALRHVSFSVQKGSVLGVIGQNGSGKSTLLKIVAGVLEPTEGKCMVNGRIAPMLELGSGFDFELSGTENIFLNGAILGYNEKYLKSKYEEIVDFSELGEFIHQPLKTYSSGMVMRLAFSIATLVEPEVLIVDEILAVGDDHFQEKSGNRMRKMMSGGTTVLMVSHNINQIIDMCDQTIWIDHGHVMDMGETIPVCNAYRSFLNRTI